jgi:hypothetical protein
MQQSNPIPIDSDTSVREAGAARTWGLSAPLLPDLLTFQDGRPVTAETWPERRAELAAILLPHEYGGLPPPGVRTEVICRSQSQVRELPGVQFHVFEVRVVFEDGRDIRFTLSLWIPPGTGPFPVLLDGDGCWRYFNEPTVVRRIVDRGNIAALIDRTEGAADNPDHFRETGLYRLFPSARFGVLSAWAWMFHRAVDALAAMPEVRADAIAITGHSRGGKTALLAGATDPRIAITNPNCSGIGGAGLHRLKSVGSETIASFFRSRNIFWFADSFRAFRERDAELPYDQHFLHALVAPRRLLVTDAYEDAGANPPGAYAACQDARRIFTLLGAPEAINWTIREGGHAHLPQDYESLLDFMDRHLHGREVKRDFQRVLYPGLEEKMRGDG